MTSYSDRVNKTYSKNFSKRAIVPKYIASHYSRCFNVLDYGAGKDAYGTRLLQQLGFKCVAYELGDNNTLFHNIDALMYEYDIVFASNVLNVQIDEAEINSIFLDVRSSLANNGDFVFNYPVKPRHSDVTERELMSISRDWFCKAKIEKFNNQNIYVCGDRV